MGGQAYIARPAWKPRRPWTCAQLNDSRKYNTCKFCTNVIWYYIWDLHWMTSKWTWKLQSQRYCLYVLLVPLRVSNFNPLHSTASHCRLKGHYDQSAPNDPKMTLYTIWGQMYRVHVLPVPLSPKLHSTISHFQYICQFSFSHWPQFKFRSFFISFLTLMLNNQ